MSRTPKIRAQQDACPNVAEHNYGPDGYLAWHAWAKKMMQTHMCRQCPGCGFWLIFQPRAKAEATS